MARFKVTSGYRWFTVHSDSKEQAMSVAQEYALSNNWHWFDKDQAKIRKLPEPKTPVPTVITDGGLASSSVGNERNDCTVRALVGALDIDYDSAHRLLELGGRVKGKGFAITMWMGGPGKYLFDKIYNRYSARCCGDKTYTLRSFMKDNPKGTFYIVIPGHALCVKDGVVLDTHRSSPMARIENVWVPRTL